MKQIGAFDNITSDEIQKLLKCFDATIISYKKDTTVLSNVSNTTLVGIIIKGSANVIRYNYNGTRNIIEELEEGDIFGSFSSSDSDDIYIVTKTDSKITMFSYDKLINRCHNNCPYHNKLIDNMYQIFGQKLRKNSERIEILSKKTIREKLLSYFNQLSQKQISKNIILPFSLTDLADFLSIDRSAMMREMKNMKEEGRIEAKGKKIHLNY